MNDWINKIVSEPVDRREVEGERLIIRAVEALYDAINEEGAKQADIAQRLGKSRPYVSQVLSGDRNISLRVLADFAWALDRRVQIDLVPMVDFDEVYQVQTLPIRERVHARVEGDEGQTDSTELAA